MEDWYREPIKYLSYVDSRCLGPFTSNISYFSKNNVRLCCDYAQEGRQISNFSSERSTQEANCYTKHAVTKRIPITAMHFRVNDALRLRRVGIRRRCTSNGLEWWDKNERSQLFSIKANKQLFRKVQTDQNLVCMRRIYMLLCKMAGAWIWTLTTI